MGCVYRAEGQQAWHGVLVVVDVSQDVGGTSLTAQAVLLDQLCNAAPVAEKFCWDRTVRNSDIAGLDKARFFGRHQHISLDSGDSSAVMSEDCMDRKAVHWRGRTI